MLKYFNKSLTCIFSNIIIDLTYIWAVVIKQEKYRLLV